MHSQLLYDHNHYHHHHQHHHHLLDLSGLGVDASVEAAARELASSASATASAATTATASTGGVTESLAQAGEAMLRNQNLDETTAQEVERVASAAGTGAAALKPIAAFFEKIMSILMKLLY
jgi:hypothetical protein